MKVKVSEIKPNPFRRIDHYPINREKVEQLKTSINETGFWQNLYARKNSKGEIELAYGHHRLEALKELGRKVIDIPIKKLTDAEMLKIMAAENLDHWRANTAVNNETVLAAKEYLDGEFKKHTFKSLPPDLINLLDQKSEKSFNKIKAGVGQNTILKFLGENWKQWMVQNALAAINDKDIDRKVLEEFQNPGHAEAFRWAIKESEVPIPKSQQATLASEILTGLAKPDKELTATAIKEGVQKAAHRILKNEEAPPDSLALLRGAVERLRRGSDNLISNIENFKEKPEDYGVDGRLDPLIKNAQNLSQRLSRFSQECQKLIEERTETEKALEKEMEKQTGVVKEEGVINQSELLQVLKLLKGGLAKKEFIEFTDCYFFQDNRIITYNDKRFFSASFPTGLTGAVKGKDFLKMITRIKEPSIQLSQEGNLLNVEAGEESYLFRYAEDTLDLRHMMKRRKWQKLPPDLIDGLETVSFSASRDNKYKRPLTGLFVQDDNIISCDSHRASWLKLKTAVSKPFLVPAANISGVLNQLKFGRFAVDRYFVESNWIHFKGEKIHFATLIIDEKYPDITPYFLKQPPKERILLPNDLEKVLTNAFEYFLLYNSLKDGIEIELKFKGRKLVVTGEGGPDPSMEEDRTKKKRKKSVMQEINERRKKEKREKFGGGGFYRELTLSHAVSHPFKIKISPPHFIKALEYSREMSMPYSNKEGKQLIEFFPENFRHILALGKTDDI